MNTYITINQCCSHKPAAIKKPATEKTAAIETYREPTLKEIMASSYLMRKYSRLHLQEMAIRYNDPAIAQLHINMFD